MYKPLYKPDRAKHTFRCENNDPRNAKDSLAYHTRGEENLVQVLRK
jgi:hypothetical protein